MAGLLDASIVPAVKTIVDLFGITATFTIITGSTYDPTAGSKSAGTTTTVSAACTPPGDYKRELGPGVEIEKGDVQIGLPASGLSFTPDTTMKVTVAGKTWQITALMPIYSGEEVALYMMNLRGGK